MTFKVKSKKPKKRNSLTSEYYEVNIVRTGKPIGKKGEDYSVFDSENKFFKTKAEAKKFLKEEYGKVKKVPMYRDTPDGKGVKTGYVFGFKNKDVSHDSKSWYQQDWVEIRKIKSTPTI